MASKAYFLTEKYGQDLKPLLRKLYVEERKTMREIGDTLGVDAVAIYYRLKKFGIPTRDRHDHPTTDKVRENARLLGRSRRGAKQSDESKKKISDSRKGRVLKPSKYGGHLRDRNGYVYVYCPSHPHSSADGYVMEHRLVMESYIGRYLDKDEAVHHKNGKRNDNRIENLQLMTCKEHASYHMKKRHEERRGKN
jgi:hypothetical protein